MQMQSRVRFYVPWVDQCDSEIVLYWWQWQIITQRQKWNTRFVFGLEGDSMRETLRHYLEWFFSQRIPERSMIHQHVIHIIAFVLNWMCWGSLWSVNTPDLEERVLCYVEEKPGLVQGRLQLQRKPSKTDLHKCYMNSYTNHTISLGSKPYSWW
jgi:hypothetical protein